VDETRYSIGEIAERGGVTRRTIRYYVQRGLIPEPLGRGRGEHYSAEHLAAVLRVKALQEQGATLDEIRRGSAGEAERQSEPESRPAPAQRAEDRQVRREQRPGQLWVRQTVMPGFELHVHGEDNALTERQLAALARFLSELEGEGGNDGS